MVVTFNCPECQKIFSLDDEMRGKRATCTCGYALRVPGAPESPGSPDNFQALVRRVFADKHHRLVGDCLYVAPDIPGKKLANALNTFAMGVNGNDVLLLMDNTVFGSAKDGCLMTDDALYWHNAAGPFQKLELSVLNHVRVEQGVIVKELYLNHTECVETCLPTIEILEAFADMLTEIAALQSEDGQGPASGPVEEERATAMNQLKELKALHEQGILTDEEFAQKRQQYIDKL